MNRPGPISTLAKAVGALNLLLVAARLPATFLGLGWLTTVFVLITAPLGVLVAVVGRTREPDDASRQATNQAVLWSGAALALHLLLLLVLGP